MSNRNFTISDINNKAENTGLYKGKLPGQAASKAARKIFEMFPRNTNIQLQKVFSKNLKLLKKVM
jgi:hypothetical protein